MFIFIITFYLLLSAVTVAKSENGSVKKGDVGKRAETNNFTITTETSKTIDVAQDDSQKNDNTSSNKSILQKEEIAKQNNSNQFLITQKELLKYSQDLFTFNINKNKGPKLSTSALQCIACNNLQTSNCTAPENIMPTIVCNNSIEICYSAHTPFGIVDRGCINVLEHMHTYVCKCNLCNHQSISDIPVIFNSKTRWEENVFEIAHKRRLQNTIFKEMSCLKCEVNLTRTLTETIFDGYCLEGVINKLPTEVCMEDQICAVKAIREQGYIWRGCVTTPLYNYWWTFCDSDLCNDDILATVYDAYVSL